MIPRYRAWFGSEMYDKPVVYDGEFYRRSRKVPTIPLGSVGGFT